MKRPVHIWVHPSFRTKIKTEASKRGKSIIEFSEELCKDSEEFENYAKKKFNFRL